MHSDEHHAHADGETSARTRPFSFEEIMRRRKNKETSEILKDEDVESGFKSGDDFVESAHDESGKYYKQKKESSPDAKKQSSKEFDKESDGKKQESSLITQSDKYGKQGHGENHQSDIFEKPLSPKVEKLGKEKYMENNDLETKLKVENNKDVSSNRKSQSEKEIEDMKFFNEREKHDFENNAATNKRSRDITGKDRHRESRRRENPERESKRKYPNGEDDTIEDRNAAKTDDRGRGYGFENNAAANKHSRDITGKDRHEHRRESKRKYLHGEDENFEDRNAEKRDDFGQRHGFENKRTRDIIGKDVHEHRRKRPERESKDEKIEDQNAAKRDDFGKGHDFENKRARDIVGKDRHENRRERPEKEIKRKYPNGVDEKMEDRNTANKDDLGKGHGCENKRPRDIVGKDVHKHRRERPERESKDEKFEDRNAAKRDDFGKGHDFENKHARDIIGKDRHENRRERPEKEIKRKYLNGEDEKLKDQDTANKDDLGKGRDFECSEKEEQDKNAKKFLDIKSRRDIKISERREKQDNNSKRTHDLESGRDLEISKRNEKQDRNYTQKYDQGKRHDVETSEKKRRKELSKSHYEEQRLRQKRSRSREQRDKNRRSASLSPRTLKHSSYHGHSGRQHSNSDKRLITRNDSGSHSRRSSGPTSGLGGYSPRKRRTDASAKTPSPTKRSPEKKIAKWDFPPPAKTENIFFGSLSNVQSSHQTATTSINPAIYTVPFPCIPSKPLNVSVDSVQLTQATRPKRRLYVDNLPDSASEKAFVEFLNTLLLSSGVNHITGTQPCISCKINKEKGQALVEFLTPEDATTALCFDGSSFSGSILNIRRPRDYVQVAVTLLRHIVVIIHVAGTQTVALFMQTGEQEKPKAKPDPIPEPEPEAAVDVMSGIVKDSPKKIFIGGISMALSSDMVIHFEAVELVHHFFYMMFTIFICSSLIPVKDQSHYLLFMEIANSFGALKTYHFEVNEDFPEQCAFLEYVDHSITLKACAALNGMKLGGQVITAVQADPNTLFLKNDGDQPFYGIPEHAKPLLKNPSQVLQLKNVLNTESLTSLSELEVDEVLEDIRVECARFGTVRSVNVVKTSPAKIWLTVKWWI
ncbi:hypothetical protein ACFE04_025594 [Oxalis oulophora]